MAPHTQQEVITEDWNRPYTREQAAFPAVSIFWTRVFKILNYLKLRFMRKSRKVIKIQINLFKA